VRQAGTVPRPPRLTAADLDRLVGPAAERRPRAPALLRLAWGLAAAGVLSQVAYPLLDGGWLRATTVGSVALLAAAAAAHAASTRGLRWAAGLVAGAAGVGFAVEAVGVATGWPFGRYAYAGTLGPSALGVPLLVPLAWLSLAYPCLLAGRLLAGELARRGRRPAIPAWALAAWTLAAWDLFLDPQMVAAGHWTWAEPAPALPGVPGIPIGNFAGWLLVAAIMMAVLDRLPRTTADGRPPRDALPAVVLVWTWSSQVLANLVFFGRPWVAVWGGLAMGVTVVPYALALRRQPPA
jgi:putative membrane protein